MVSNPGQWVNDFKAAGASQYTFHLEAVEHETIGALIEEIRATGMKVGVSIKPNTPVESLEPFADKIDNLLVSIPQTTHLLPSTPEDSVFAFSVKFTTDTLTLPLSLCVFRL
jgi:hypothetical protein